MLIYWVEAENYGLRRMQTDSSQPLQSDDGGAHSTDLKLVEQIATTLAQQPF